jgi:septal ring factor EnvC (AmiA/AmiB activator)
VTRGGGGRRLAALPAALLVALLAAPLTAQQDGIQQQIEDSQSRLNEIRAQRERLQRDMQTLQGRAQDLSSTLLNIERQVEASTEALKEMDYQAAALAANVNQITRELVRTRDRLEERNVVLHQRLRAIYRQGPLHTVRVLLSAQSFGDLLNRYKYLHLISVHDRLLLEEISALERDLTIQEEGLQQSLAQLERLRSEKLTEFAQLQQLEQVHARMLTTVRAEVSEAERRIQALAADERRLTSLVEQLERRRLEEERRRTAAGLAEVATTLSPASRGQLQWPIQGHLLYRFGPERRPNGVTLRRNGIGIAAPAGTQVRSVGAGTVVMARPMEGFGPGVVLSHGGGYYSLYLYMGEIRVREGEDVAAGQILGTVGRGPEEGSHLYLQIHAPTGGQTPVAVDPLPWLQDR